MLFQFLPPAGLSDMNDTALAAWDAEVNGYYDRAKYPPNDMFPGSRDQFVNPADGIAADAVEEFITWTAFPRPLSLASATDHERWRAAEHDRQEQVEFCEWATTRDADGKVTKIVFTCEDKQYFRVLYQHQPDVVLQLYRKHVSSKVQPSDLTDGFGNYLSTNKWNMNVSSGAMHMIGRSNTVASAIALVANASVVHRNPNGTPKAVQRAKATFGQFGDRDRHSDPAIGAKINSLAHQGHEVALSLPTQLAIDSISFAGWETPDGSPVDACWTFARGTQGHFMRGALEVPRNKDFKVGDITINGQPIVYGGQVADHLRMRLTSMIQRLGQAQFSSGHGRHRKTTYAGYNASSFKSAVPPLPRI